jgi:hypothetical protein
MLYRLTIIIFVVIGFVAIHTNDVFSANQELLYAVWSQPVGKKITTIKYSGRYNGNWKEPTELEINSGLHVTPSIGLDKIGNIWIVWIEQTVEENILRYARIKNGNTETGRILSTRNEQSYAPTLVIDSSGVPWIAWSGIVGKLADIFISHWTGSSWTVPVMVNDKNDVPDITPIMGLLDNKNLWVSWFGFDESRRYVQFFATMDNNHWLVDKKTLPSIDVKDFVKQRIGVDVELPKSAGTRLMGAIYISTGKEIQSISERFIIFE